jgi:RNA polymerase sigma factor (sigma-70 family)
MRLASPTHGITWHGLDLTWVYTDLLRSIVRHTQCNHLAFDMLHDALLRFAFNQSKDGIQQPHAYLRTVVSHVLADHYQYARHLVSLDDMAQGDSAYLDAPEFWVASPEKLADIKQRMQALQNIIDSLPAKCREVFWLFRIEGHSQAHIAAKLNITVNMVERHMMRALVDLSTARDFLMMP